MEEQVQAMVQVQTQVDMTNSDYADEQKMPRTFSISNFLDMDYIGSISHLLNDNQSYNPTSETQSASTNSSSAYNQQQYRGNERFMQGEMTYPYINQGRYQVGNQHISQQMLLNMNPVVYEFQ